MEKFKNEFLGSYLAGGMGALWKRDIDALVMHLLDEQGLDDGVPLRSLSNQQVSVKLRVPSSRIKTLRYEATLKYAAADESFAKQRFLEVFAKAKYDAEKDKSGFIIEEAFIKNWLQGILKSDGLFFDSSFNTEVVKVDSDELIDVLKALYGEKSVATFKKGIEDAKAKKEKWSFAEMKKEFLNLAACAVNETAARLAMTSAAVMILNVLMFVPPYGRVLVTGVGTPQCPVGPRCPLCSRASRRDSRCVDDRCVSLRAARASASADRVSLLLRS